MASPSRQSKKNEKLLFEYDAFAKLENSLTFVISDLTVFEEYLYSKHGSFPSTSVEQFCKDVQDFKKDAEDLDKKHGFTLGLEVANVILREIDFSSHRSVQEMTKSKEISRLEKALHNWAVQEQQFPEWKRLLTSLGKIVTAKMDDLQKQIG
jgi:hypothetical protein